MWYITTDIEHCIKTGGLGGLGQMFYLYLTSYMIALMFDIEHVYYPFRAAGTTKHQREKSNEVLVWEDLINFEQDEKHFSELKCKKIYLPKIKPFQSYTLDQLRKFFSEYDRNEEILFLVGNTNRILPGEFYDWCDSGEIDKELYTRLLEIVRTKCNHQVATEPGLVVIQVRRGDANYEPLSYYVKTLDEVLANYKPNKIAIISLGTAAQMKQVRALFSKYQNVEYYINYNTIESFKIMMNAEILIAGVSSFPKVAGLYTDVPKYILPFDYYYHKLKCREIPFDGTWFTPIK